MRNVLLIFLLIIVAAVIPVIVIIGPQLDFSLLIPEPEEPEPEQPTFDPDMLRYYELKNTSCDTLADDFLIVTDDVAHADIQGLIPATEDEPAFAESMLSEYNLNQTTKTYVRKDQMKKVMIADGNETTNIWKNGRIYTCAENCTMRLMDDQDSEEYYGELDRIKSSCAYFGKTKLPENLLIIEKTGVLEINGYVCENFLISLNSSAIQTLEEGLDENQTALLWGLIRLSAPVQECLDESAGIIVMRNITIDLTDSYNFEFEENGSITVNQVTKLTYFTDQVPESFFALPD